MSDVLRESDFKTMSRWSGVGNMSSRDKLPFLDHFHFHGGVAEPEVVQKRPFISTMSATSYVLSLIHI